MKITTASSGIIFMLNLDKRRLTVGRDDAGSDMDGIMDDKEAPPAAAAGAAAVGAADILIFG
jgi:hypothetical protein